MQILTQQFQAGTWDCVFDNAPGNAAASGPLTTLWVDRIQMIFQYVVIIRKATVAILVGASHSVQFYL